MLIGRCAQALEGEEETGRPSKKGRHKRTWEEASSDEAEDEAEIERQKAEEARERDQAEKAQFEERLKAKVSRISNFTKTARAQHDACDVDISC